MAYLKRPRYKKWPAYKRKFNARPFSRLTVTPRRYLANPVQHRIISQLKYNQVQYESVLAHNAWSVFLLNSAIAVGTGQKNARSGDKICIEKILLRINCQSEDPAGTETWPLTVSNSAVTVRLVVVEDKQANGLTLASGDVFDAGFTSIQNFNNLGNRERFRILEDRHVRFCQGAKNGGQEVFYLKPKILVNYDPTTTNGTLPTIKTGAVYLLATAFKHYAFVGSDNSFTINIASRIRYTDM